MANCSLSEQQKRELHEWAEQEQPKQAELRERVRSLVSGTPRPDFDLKVTNFWKFSRKPEEMTEFDGGIHPDLVANLIYYFF